MVMVKVPKGRPQRRTFFREWRKFRGLTQERAAERIGNDRTTLSKIERGEVSYTQGFLEAAAEAYMCEPADLLMRDPNSPIWSIWDTLKALDAPAQEQVVKIIETFRKAG